MNDTNHTAVDDSGDDTIRMEHSPGSTLRKLREAAGLSHASVGEALHLTVHYVKALESDEYGKLPGLTFVKGYLRSYARLMKADVDAVMASFELHIAGLVDAGQRTEQVQRSRRRHDQALRWAIATSVILVLGIAGGWWFKGKDASSADATPATSQAIIGATTSAITPARSEPAAAPVARSIATQPPAVDPDQPAQADALSNPAASIVSTVPSVPAALVSDDEPQAAPASVTDATGAAVVSPAPDVTAFAATPANADAPPAAELTAAADPQALQSGDVLTVTPAEDGSRLVNLVSSGDDLLELSFSGSSWVEIDDGSNTRLYNDMLRSGDALTIHGAAPFHLLLGDAANVAVKFNSEAVNIAADIRGDSTARLVLFGPASSAETIQTATGVPR